MAARLGSDGAPPALPIASLLLGAVALLVGSVWLLMNAGSLLGPFNTPRMVAVTHLFTLGFVSLIFAGTLQQLPAVMFVTKLAWPNLGYLTTPLLLFGTAAVVWGFATGFNGLLLAGGAAAVSGAWLLLLLQILVTASRRPPKDPGSRALLVSVAYLTLTVLLGFLLAAARSQPELARALGYPARLHLTVGLFGAFLLGIAGSGQKLLSMFALSKGGAQWRVSMVTYFVTAALLAEGLVAFAHLPLRPLPQLLLAVGALFQLLEVREIYRRRLRKRLELPIRRYVLAHTFLPLAGLLALLGFEAAAAIAFLVGFVGLAVSGMLVKILSFLTWTARFAGAPGGGVSGGAPLLRDLMRDELEPITTWALLLGTLCAVGALLLAWPPAAYAAAALFTVGAASQLLQVVNVIATTELSGRRLERAARAAAAKPVEQKGGSAHA